RLYARQDQGCERLEPLARHLAGQDDHASKGSREGPGQVTSGESNSIPVGARAMKYPAVIGEFDTMREVAAGKSLARFGDGGLQMMYGAGYGRQKGSLAIATELFNVLNQPAENCLVGTPTLDPNGPKYQNWLKHQERFERVIQRAGPFYSAFVTRPDSAPWIETEEYLQLVLSVWSGKRSVLVCEPSNKLLPVMKRTAGALEHVECPSYECYPLINTLKRAILKHKPEVVVLSCGVTATCLANRLAGEGVHTLDFGSAGGMMARLSEPKEEEP